MARVEIRLKDDLLAEWDAWAGAHGLTRTQFLVTAARALMVSRESLESRVTAHHPSELRRATPEEVARAESREPAREVARADREVVVASEPVTRSSVPVRASYAQLMLERQRKLNESRG